ncbi:MAG: type III-B CRISPR-associated protein Cas10/Cmr2 [Candidatus Poribacteria bacterium]|nr:MAG: type III-B CRISPR-associated protein Cas10/Cmr2 [Candidatus Poribacteria bacterium]
MTTKSKHYLVFHLGPVQGFIAAARRTQDLWFGSWLLSELARAAARELARLHGGQIEVLIFPAPERVQELEDSKFAAPNRVVALIEGDRNPREVAESVRAAVIRRLREIRNEAFNRVPGEFSRDRAEKQVDDLLEFYWASCALGGEVGYSQARELAEALLESRKKLRDFQPVSWGDSVPKSSLDGLRESVIPEEAYKILTPAERWEKYRVRGSERLCGVALMKRWGALPDKGSFPSTSDMAVGPLLSRLERIAQGREEEYQQKVSNLEDRLRELGVPEEELRTGWNRPILGRLGGQLLFEERMSDLFPEEPEKAQRAARTVRQFLDEVFGPGVRPIPYFAVLRADGDQMGETISRLKSPQDHQELSRCLVQFAHKAREIVERDHGGATVYAGGDDLLTFLPLHQALECACTLRTAFGKALESLHLSNPPTLSVGVVVAHHLDPLSDTLNLARRTEQAAKSVPGKNALAVTVSKRSGDDRTVQGKWGELDERLIWFAHLHMTDQIPDRAAYQLRELVVRLPEERLPEAAKKEALRILKRKEPERGSSEVSREVLRRLEGYLHAGVSVEQLAEELIVAREFAAAKLQANPQAS